MSSSPAAARRPPGPPRGRRPPSRSRSEEHTSELQSRQYVVCRILLEKKKRFERLAHYSKMRHAPSATAKVGLVDTATVMGCRQQLGKIGCRANLHQFTGLMRHASVSG